MFKGYDTSRLKDPTTLGSRHLSAIEGDDSTTLNVIRDLFCARFSIDPEPHERRIIKHLVVLIATRAVRLFVCGIAAICKKKRLDRCHVAIDGSTFDEHSKFQERAIQAIHEIFDSGAELRLQVTGEKWSGLGAALAAAEGEEE